MKRGGPGKGGGQDPLTPPSGHAYGLCFVFWKADLNVNSSKYSCLKHAENLLNNRLAMCRPYCAL